VTTRRRFMELLGGAATAWPIAARAQQMRRIAVFMDLAEGDPEGRARVAALKRGLQDLGWIEGRSLRIEQRWAGGEATRMKPLAEELVSLAPEVIVSSGAPTLAALQQATRAIPLVFGGVVDPVAAGFVDSLTRPGGNITGFTNFEFAMGGKWLGTLKEIAPGIARIAVLRDPPGPGVGAIGMFGAIQAVMPSFALPLTIASGRDAAEFERAIDTFATEPNGGLIVLPAPNTISHRQAIIASVARRRVPTIYPYRFFVKDGGLISYGIVPSDLFRRAAAYVDAILKGTKPSDLPVQQPTKYEMVINLATAKSLGLTVPPTLLARADEVIE
jgi:ABC-type uncharacterized transport system substrate-binding protein